MVCICRSISSGQWSLLEMLLIYNQRTDMCGRSAGFSTACFYTPQERFDKRWITALQSNHRLDFDIRLHACTGISLLIKSTTRACDAPLFWTLVCAERKMADAVRVCMPCTERQRPSVANFCCWKHTNKRSTETLLYLSAHASLCCSITTCWRQISLQAFRDKTLQIYFFDHQRLSAITQKYLSHIDIG